MGADYKKIAKNTGFLYFRMAINLLVSLYTARIILQALGLDDYGIYTLVGGVISMIAFFQSTLTNVNLRFFSFELGTGNKVRLSQLFRLSNTVYWFLLILVVLIAETLGLWFVNTQLVIPSDRLFAANVVYQCSIFSFAATLLSIPSNASVISHENMNVFAYVGLFQVFAKLLITLLLIILPVDKLILLCLFDVLLSIVVLCVFNGYASRHYEEFSLRFYWNKQQLKEMLPFVSWNLIGCAAWSFNTQGINILLNVFFSSLVVNAARGIAFQVNNLTKMFSGSVYSAFRPQITKTYAAGDHKTYHSLLYNSSKYSFYLSWLVSLPILLNCPFFLFVWLGKYPDYAVLFTILTILFSLVDVFNEPIWTAVQATGKLFKYQFYGNLIFFAAFPLSYIALKAGVDPSGPMWILLFVRLLYMIVIVYMVRKNIGISVREYLIQVIAPVAKVVVISLLVTYPVYYWAELSVVASVLYVFFIVLATVGIIYLLGISKQEQAAIVEFVKNKIKNK